MTFSLSQIKDSVASHLIAGLTLFLFLGWFVLPSCHCQWDALFGGSETVSQSPDLSFDSDCLSASDLACHCDDHSGKTFEIAADQEQPRGFQGVALITSSRDLRFESLDGFRDVLVRGPPESFVHHAEQRVYLRHRSLLL